MERMLQLKQSPPLFLPETFRETQICSSNNFPSVVLYACKGKYFASGFVLWCVRGGAHHNPLHVLDEKKQIVPEYILSPFSPPLSLPIYPYLYLHLSIYLSIHIIASTICE
jgi:hypothetical protein